MTRVVDVILPKSDIPSASEVNVPQFIDKFMNEIFDDEAQAMAKESFGGLISVIKSDYNENLSKVTDDDIKNLLETHMRIKGEEDEERLANPESTKPTKSEFLNQLKGFSKVLKR